MGKRAPTSTGRQAPTPNPGVAPAGPSAPKPAAPTKPIGPEQYRPFWGGSKKKPAKFAPADPLITLAMDRFKLCCEAEATTRAASLDDWRFRTGEQWPSEIVAQREVQKRPCLTVNRLPAFTRQVCNEQRQQRPSITINPVGDGADVDTAEIEQGLVRHVEINSQADVSYDTAFEQMITGGRGYWRLRTAYVGDVDFQQEVYIEPILNPFSVYTDPATIKPDKSDMRFGFITYDVPTKEYPGRYPNSELAARLRQTKGGETLTGAGDFPQGWCDSKFIRLAEYFHIEEDGETTLYLLESGEIVETVPEGAKVERTRTVKNLVCKWNLINAVESLEAADWVIPSVPIYEVTGDDFIVDGKRYVAGLLRDAKDPQRMFNFWFTGATETIALAPRSPYIGTSKNFEQYQVMWQQANNSPQAYLVYDPDPTNQGVMPQRQQFEPPIQAMAQMLALCDNNLKAVLGIFDASLGAPGPEQSGKAVLARQAQSINGNANWTDNLGRTIRRCGRDLLAIFPKLYDVADVRRIVKPDGTAAMVGIYSAPEGEPEPILPGVSKCYNIGVGKYDVTVTVGPSFQSKRQEASTSMLELVKVNPAVFPLIGDLMVANMDWPHAQEIAKRLKTLLPPQLQDGDPNDPVTQLAQKNGQLQQLMQQHQQLAQLVQTQAQIIQQKQVEGQIQLKLQQMKNDAAVIVAEIEAKSQQASARAKADQAAIEMAHDAAHELAMRETAPPPVLAPGGNPAAGVQPQPPQNSPQI